MATELLHVNRAVSGAATSFELPIEGMTCASCVARVEKAIARVPGVTRSSVNLATEKASIEAESLQAQAAVADAVRAAGYEVPEQEVVLSINGVTCASCVARVEKSLNKVVGVSSASVNLATEQATVRALASVSPDALVGAVQKAGYDASIPATDIEPSPKQDLAALKVAGAAVFSAPLVVPMAAQGVRPPRHAAALAFVGSRECRAIRVRPAFLQISLQGGAREGRQHGLAGCARYVGRVRAERL